jgi:glutamate-1-semialdehyde 2,1-aminomutase
MSTQRKTDKSRAAFERASRLFPGGVNSPVRAFKAVGGQPVFLARGQGAYVWDVDGNEYIDFMGSWGPLILGHADPDVLEAIRKTAENGTTFGASTELEIALGEELRAAVPSMERMRLVSSGTEATMSALRLARGFTGRHKIVKIEGAYHGHADMLLVAAGSGAATLGIPGSAGVTPSAVADTLLCAWNDEAGMRAALESNRGQVAAVIVEPVPGNMGLVPPASGYLAALRRLCDEHGALLIFDEVITGFRVGRGGAQGLYGIKPDLTCLGKIAGGGLPLGVYGGRADVLGKIAPEGPVYQAGTLSGNPLAVAAGLATLRKLTPALYQKLEALGRRLEEGLVAAIRRTGTTARVQRLGSAFTLFFNDGPVTDFASAKRSDSPRFGRFFHELLERGVYLPPAQLEAGFISGAHTENDVDAFIAAADPAMKASIGPRH